MDVILLIGWVGLIYFLSILRQNRRRRNAEARRDEAARDIPPETPESPDIPEETEAPAAEAGGYDYGDFRRRLRRAWKLPEDGNGDAPDEEKAAQDASQPEKEERREPRMEPAEKQGGRQDAPRPRLTKEEEERRRIWQDYAGRGQTAAAAAPAAFSASSGKELRRAVRKSWTEEDARQWARYDAVFGAPRAKVPWRPASLRRG